MSDNEISFIANLLINKVIKSNPGLTVDAFLDKFMNESAKVNFVYNLLGSYDLFPPFDHDLDGKNEEIARICKEDGNEMFASGLYLEALKIYTRCISTAQSEDLKALAYANRSSCLFKLKLFQEGLVDIERALESGYPLNLRPKLFARRTATLKALKPVQPWHEEIPTFPESARNKLIQCARDCVEIRASEKYGRHIVASRDLDIGEVIAVEEPFSTQLLQEKLIHCHECLKLCYNLIPCSSCTETLYCSKSCKEKAFNDYHKVECSVLAPFRVLTGGDDGVLLLALKATLLSGVLSQENPFPENFDDQIFHSGRYKEVHYLAKHTEQMKPFDLFYDAVLAAVVFKHLNEKNNLFQNKLFERNFQEIFYRLIHVCPINSMSVSELFVSNPPLRNCNFGRGLYSFGSLLNHSCCPNVERYFYGSTMVLRANATIMKGQQCFITYGPDASSSTAERQSFLAIRYYFICTCEACRENWTLNISEEIFSSRILNLNPGELLTRMRKVCAGEINEARNMLTELQSALRTWEGRQAEFGKDIVCKLRQLIYESYAVFANKRRI